MPQFALLVGAMLALPGICLLLLVIKLTLVLVSMVQKLLVLNVHLMPQFALPMGAMLALPIMMLLLLVTKILVPVWMARKPLALNVHLMA
jgi:hypothetical protein